MDKDELIVILGKKFNEPETGAATKPPSDMTKYGNSSFYFCNDSNVGLPTSVDLETNYSIINQPDDENSLQNGFVRKKTPTTPAISVTPARSKQPLSSDENEHESSNNTKIGSLTDNLNLAMTYSILSSSSSFFSNLMPKSLSSDSLNKK